MTRLWRYLTSFSLRRLPSSPQVTQRLRWATVGLALLFVAVALFSYTRRPQLTDPAHRATTEARVYLQDVEVAARLAVLKTWLQDRRDLDELQPLYTSATDLLRTAHTALPPDSAVPTWLDLEPLVTRLGVQLADGDAAAVDTVDALLSALGAF